jgi:hypothetical protein
MSLQGPLIVVAETPATELTQALSAAGAFPIVEATWADAPTAFVSVKPAAVIIAEPGPPPSESSARMLCLQIATASGPIVPTIGLAYGDLDAALPVALPADASLPVARIVARLQSALGCARFTPPCFGATRRLERKPTRCRSCRALMRSTTPRC